jgi:hypothetical protein
MNKFILKNYTDDIIYKYVNLNINSVSLSKEYNVKPSSICRLLNKNNIIINISKSHQKYTINSNYFKNINSEKKAYFLGLLYADGCLHSNRKSINLSLIEDDVDIIEEFKNELQYNGNIKTIYYNNKGYKNQKLININNMSIYNDLITLGCIPKKSLILQFPNSNQVPNEYLHHFIRGYFDGDGCIGKTNGQKYVSFLGTYNFLEKLKEYLTLNCKLNNIKIQKTKSKAFVYQIRGNLQISRIFNFLYNDSKIYLNRKYIKFIT